MNDHYQELTVVSKEALKRKRDTYLQCAELKQIVRGLQQQNEEHTKRMRKMEFEQKKEKKKAQALDGITLLAEATKDI